MRHKKTLAFLSIMFSVMVFFASLPEILNHVAIELISVADAATTGTVAGVYVDADYSTSTLTAVLTDSDGDDIDVPTGSTVTYAWSSSTDGDTYTDVSGATSSTLTFSKGYYYKVKVTVDSTDEYTSTAKKTTTEIASVKLQNDIYRYSVFTAVFLNSEGDVLYFSDGNGGMTTYNSNASYEWYSIYSSETDYASNVTNSQYLYSDGDDVSPDSVTGTFSDATETKNKNTLTPTMSNYPYYYYVKATVNSDEYTSNVRIATIYTGISVEIEQTLETNGDITLQMIVYDENGDVMLDNNDDYYYNEDYTTTWYKSKEYFTSTGDGTTADEDSKVKTSATIPLGYAPQDYYKNSNYMRVSDAAYNKNSNTVGYTNTYTVSGEVGRYYYVDINSYRTNGSAEAGADPVFVRNCKSTVVVEDHIADEGTYKAVVYNSDGDRVDDTSSYTFTWYKTTDETTSYTDSKDNTENTDTGKYISSYDQNAYYFDSGKFTYNAKASNKTSEFGSFLPDTADDYDEVRDNFDDELDKVSDVFKNANYEYSTDKTNFTVTSGSEKNDGATCNVANDEGQLRYYYVVVALDTSTTYASLAKYVKYSDQIENGGFQDYQNTNTSSSAFEASTMAYWETTNKGYSESYKESASTNEQYYRMHPLLEIANYLGNTSYGTYGNYYAYPGLFFDSESTPKSSTLDSYLNMDYTTDSTTDYVFNANMFCEMNSTDSSTLYQTVMTVPDMPLYWSLSHHARGGTTILSASLTNETNKAKFSKYTNDQGNEIAVYDLGATTEQVQAAIDIMYVVIMDENDAEAMLYGADQAKQQEILNAMILYITTYGTSSEEMSSDDGGSYLVRYDGSYTYNSVTYNDISLWKVQTGSTKITLDFGTYTTGSSDADTAATNAEAAAKDKELLSYYAKTYGVGKSYCYSSASSDKSQTTYYTTFYTESRAYAAKYNIPDDQHVSRYFFVAASKYDADNLDGNTSNWTNLSFGSNASSYSGITAATNSASSGNFVDNVVFSQQLKATVNYWVYDDDSGEYVLDKTEQSRAIQDTSVSGTYTDDYYSQYRFVGSYISLDGGDKDTPANETLTTDTSFKVNNKTALVMDLYYQPYKLSINKDISGLSENNMTYADFRNDKLQITLYALTDSGGSYTKATTATLDKYLVYDNGISSGTGVETLTLSTDYELKKGTYLITETTYLLLTDLFEGWDSVDMYLEDGMLTYDESLGGYILVIGEDSDEAGTGEWDSVIELSVLNTYKPVAVQSTKSVLLGETDVEDINKNKLKSDDPDNDTSLAYQSLTNYDSDRSVDDAGITDNSERLAVLSGDTLTYRMELASTGRASSQDVVVTDTVPDGCTLQIDSIQILKQARQSTTNYYGVVKTVLTSTGGGSVSGDVTTWTYTDGSASFNIKYNSRDDKITWEIPSIASTEQYYVEYAVTVDQIDPSTESALLTNTAEWTYLSKVNSGTGMSMTSSIDGSATFYTATFSDLNDLTVEMITDKLPVGFTIDTNTIKVNGISIASLSNYTIIYYDANGDELTGSYSASAIASFTISYDSGITQSSGTITLTFSGTQSASATSDVDIRNTAGITYNQGGSDKYTCCVAYGNGITNEVETDVTHLYLEVDKDIVTSHTSTDVDNISTDTEQTFIFIVKYYSESKDPDNDEADSITYVTINCDSGTGSRLVQVDKRGTYTVAEVPDWSATDYDYIPGGYLDATYVDDDIITIDYKKGSTYVGSAGAFATTLGLASKDHATATFYNTKSTYAYRSSQAYAKNSISTAD